MNNGLHSQDTQVHISFATEPLSNLFHSVNHVIPDDQRLTVVKPNTPVTSAFQLMKEHGFSQLPVVEGGTVLGVFSFRSFATRMSEIRMDRAVPEELPVDEFLEQVKFVDVTDDALSIIENLEDEGVVLVGRREHLQALVTRIDLVSYLDRVSRPFLLLGEIELSIRQLIAMCVDEQGLAECLANSHGHLTDDGTELPLTFEEMTFNDYAQIVGDGRNWPRFQSVFGGTRERARARLEEIRELRNAIFHFRGDREDEEVQIIYEHRNWFLTKVRIVEARPMDDIYE